MAIKLFKNKRVFCDIFNALTENKDLSLFVDSQKVFLENFSLNFVLESSFVKEPGDLKWKLFSQSGKNLFSSTKELYEAKVMKVL
jgi:hypothetical protein